MAIIEWTGGHEDATNRFSDIGLTKDQRIDQMCTVLAVEIRIESGDVSENEGTERWPLCSA